MGKRTGLIMAAGFVLASAGAYLAFAKGADIPKTKGCYMGKYKGDKVIKTDAEWKKVLTDEQYRILRGHDTEKACTGLYWDSHEKGVYHCAGCGLELFVSDSKFHSGTGWPSFFKPIYPENVASKPDHSYGM